MKNKIPENLLWKMIAQSDVIVRAKIMTDLTNVTLKPQIYLELAVNPVEILMGTDVPDTIPLKYFVTKPENVKLKDLAKQNLLLFLKDYRHDKYNQCFFLVSQDQDSGFFVDDPDSLRRVKSEIQNYKEIISQFTIHTQGLEADSIEKEVKGLIEEMMDAQKAPNAYKKLEELGEKAVPAIIRNMNDMRDLPVKHIQLENKSVNAWEAFRHYGPQKIVDVLAAILNQIIGESFGEIHNGGTEKQRLKEYHGWIVWLSKQK